MTERQPIHQEAATAPEAVSDPRLDAAMQTLDWGIDAVMTSEGFERYLTFMSRFHVYSARNSLMILTQNPDATKVMGYGSKDKTSGWLSVGRQVRKGEKAIKIFRPYTVRQVDGATGELREVVTGFGIANVFDIAQTDGEPLPEPPRAEDLLTGSEHAGRLYDAVRTFVEGKGITVIRGTLPKKGAKGYWHPEKREIGIGRFLFGDQALKTMAHEAAHFLADHRMQVNRSDAESVAEGAAFVFCHHHGIDTSQYSFPYLAGWAKDRQTFLRNAGEIQRVSRMLIDGARKQLEEVVLFDRQPTRDELLPNITPPHLRKRK